MIKTFGVLSKEQKTEMFHAWLDGKTIQVKTYTGYGSYEWNDVDFPEWRSYQFFRIKPKSKYETFEGMKNIPWDIIDEKWQWAAMDSDGTVCFYDDKPMIAEYDASWVCSASSDNPEFKEVFVGTFVTDGVIWNDSLTKRPDDV